jgi:hypothetical protein
MDEGDETYFALLGPSRVEADKKKGPKNGE